MSKVNKIEKIETPADVDDKEITKQVEIIKEEKVEQQKKRGRKKKETLEDEIKEEKKKEKQEESQESVIESKPNSKVKRKVEESKNKVTKETKKIKETKDKDDKTEKTVKIEHKVEPEKQAETKEAEIETDEETENEEEHSLAKESVINLKDIKEALKNKVDNTQKKSLIKELLINFASMFLMVFHLFVLYMGSKNIELNILINDMKIITLCILALGIGTLEFSYKKDEFRIALRGLEVLVFGASNLCLVYVAKLYFTEVPNFLKYIGVVIIAYYIVKITLTAIFSIRKYKKDNNDIKDIVKK